ncbi:MAG: D-aminoacyl-tRNA deacylase [archaeon]
MYKKFLIIACKKNLAAVNITTQLSQFRKNPIISSMGDEKPSFDFYLTEEEVLFNENIDMEKINKYDFVIFPCTHRSEKQEKSLSIHAPGNWRDARLGGEEGKVSLTSAQFQKQIFERLNLNAKKYNLDKKYQITLECTHHGPTINKPCIFIEIGSSENEWKDNRAGFVIAKTISEAIDNFKENPYNEVAIGIGGPHYCPNFNKIQLSSNVAISHVIPNYVAPITEEMIREAIKKTTEEIDFAVLDWKGLGTSEQRQQVLNILDKLYVSYKRTSEV